MIRAKCDAHITIFLIFMNNREMLYHISDPDGIIFARAVKLTEAVRRLDEVTGNAEAS